MIRQTLAVAGKELQILMRDKAAFFVLFLMPLLLATVIGGPSTFAKKTSEAAAGEEPALQVQAYVVNLDAGAYGVEVVKALEGISVLALTRLDSLSEADSMVAQGEKPAAIVVPADFSTKIDAGESTAVQILADPAQEQATGIVAGIVNQAVAELGTVAEIRYGIHAVLEQAGTLKDASPEVRAAVEAQTLGAIWAQVEELRKSPVISLESEDLAGVKTKPAGGPMDWYIAGFAVMFAFFILTVVSPAMLQEREQGTFRRLLASPASRAALVAGVMLTYTLVVFMQLVFLFGVGRLAFHINLGQSWLGLGLTWLATALAATTLGLLVGAVSKSSEQANNLGMLLAFVLAIVGGFPIPWFKLGGAMAFVSNLTPHAHAIQAIQGLTVEAWTLAQTMPHILIVLGFAMVFFLVAVWRYRFE
jgi:ABC-2 type transport system permease protein